MKKNIFLPLIICLSLIYSCSQSNLDVDISKQTLQLNFHNLDSVEFNEKNVEHLKSHILKGDYKHDEIVNYQFNYCLSVGNIRDDSSYISLKKFTEDPYFKRVHTAISQQLYADLPAFNKEISDGFKRLKVHDNNFKVPQRIIYINSAFSSSIFSAEHEIGVSLERYLPDTAKVIQELPSEPFYDWVKKKFDKRYLVRDVFLGWITTHFVSVDGGTMADKMIQYGKALYLTKAALPNEKDAVILRYDNEQYKWARENEFNFWDYLVRQKLLYTTNERDHSNSLNDGPSTAGLPEIGPDRMGQFLGYQIVLNYMKEHPKTSLSELINRSTTDILKEYNIK